MKLFTVETEITDINDHAPTLKQEQSELKIRESATLGAHLSLFMILTLEIILFRAII